jgi:hypothetical protein
MSDGMPERSKLSGEMNPSWSESMILKMELSRFSLSSLLRTDISMLSVLGCFLSVESWKMILPSSPELTFRSLNRFLDVYLATLAGEKVFLGSNNSSGPSLGPGI